MKIIQFEILNTFQRKFFTTKFEFNLGFTRVSRSVKKVKEQ